MAFSLDGGGSFFSENSGIWSSMPKVNIFQSTDKKARSLNAIPIKTYYPSGITVKISGINGSVLYWMEYCNIADGIWKHCMHY